MYKYIGEQEGLGPSTTEMTGKLGKNVLECRDSSLTLLPVNASKQTTCWGLFCVLFFPQFLFLFSSQPYAKLFIYNFNGVSSS